VCLLAGAWPAEARAPRAAGGTFRVVTTAEEFDYVDPALAISGTSWSLLDATCAHLLRYPDKPSPASLRLVPEVAVGPPRSSGHGKTFTFTVRAGFRFSDGSLVTAASFAHEIKRVQAAGRRYAGYAYVGDIAAAVASGNRLLVRMRSPAPDFPARTATPFFCAVPTTVPPDPEGVRRLPGSGPYFVSEYVPGQRVVLARNQYYTGGRPHHVDHFVLDLTAATPQAVLRDVDSGRADWGYVAPPIYYDPSLGLVAKYRLNKSRLFLKPGLELRKFALNVQRPLFRDNLALRRAVNYAIDRRTLSSTPGAAPGTPTDQYVPSGMPGFRDVHLYPLNGPDVRKARHLARGHTRSGKAELWTFDFPPALAAAQVMQRDLKAIGIDVHIRGIPNSAYVTQVDAPGARYDIAFSPWTADFLDPAQYIDTHFDSRAIGTTNFSRLNSADSLIRRAAKLEGAARYRAYGALDVKLARDVAPAVATVNGGETTFVSARVGCIILQPYLDLTAACLK